MKLKIFIACLAGFLAIKQATAQNLLIDKKGTAHFFSEAPLENIEAINESAIGAIDLDKGTVAVTMLVKNFHFDKSLMEEHFNENYLETEKYPKATFKGTIRNFEELDFSTPGTFTVKADGILDIHGVKKSLSSDVEFIVSESEIAAKTNFKVALKDHKIKIPKLVIKNIAEVVDVDATFNFIKK